MRHGVLCFLLLVLLPMASAIPNTPYVVVLGASAPASDAVEGANYAASMRAATGITFTSQLEITTVESPEKFYVWIDGRAKTIRISGMDDARVEENTRAYFSRKGWTVLEGAPLPVAPPAEDVVDTTKERNTSETAPAVPPAEQPLADDEAETAGEEREDGAPATPPDTTADAPPTEEPRPNLFVQAWRWVIGLFS